MKKHQPAIALLTACLCLLLCACGASRSARRESVSLWVVEGDALAAPLETLLAEYNRDGKRVPVSLRTLSDEASLAALEGARPDLLLCSEALSQELLQRGLLRAHKGQSVFPLGARVQLLCLAPGVQPPEDLEELCRAAADYGRAYRLPFFTADSFAQLLAALRLQSGLDETAAYNLLAGAAFNHGMLLTELPAAALVQGGALPCAVADSARLPGLELDGCRVLPLPGFADGDCPAQLRCLALCAREGRDLQAVSAFLDWLFEGPRARDLALAGGLVPLAECELPAAESPLNDALSVLAAPDALLSVPPAQGQSGDAAFEAEFRSAMARLLDPGD